LVGEKSDFFRIFFFQIFCYRFKIPENTLEITNKKFKVEKKMNYLYKIGFFLHGGGA